MDAVVGAFAALLAGAAAWGSPVARASAFTADFSRIDSWDPSAGGRGLWNPVESRVQAPLSTQNLEIDFGDGSDGDFVDGPAQTGIQVSGNTITIDTDAKAVFRFKSFALGAGKTLRATGAAPLRIRVLGNAAIAGTIDLRGATGTGNSANGPANGGEPGAGGGQGGDAGYGTAPGLNPSQSGAPGTGNAVRGGGSGSNSGGTQNGGGGGCNGLGASGANAQNGDGDGAAGACSAPNTRAAIAASFETVLAGGAGGGGGGGYTVGSPNQVSGSGGGGGGGALHFSALGRLNLSGSITVRGGDGGSNDFTHDFANCGGAGGGGSGGSIWIQASALSGAGTVDVGPGDGGTNTACFGDFSGGAGSNGVLRTDSVSGTLAGATLSVGPSFRASTTYAAYSKPIALPPGYVSIAEPTEAFDTTGAGCVGGQTQVTYEGSRDGVVFEHAVTKGRISELNDYPYLRFKVTMVTGASGAPCLKALSIPFEPRELEEIRLEGGLFCGNIASNTGKPGGPGARGALGDFALLATAMACAWGWRARRSAARIRCTL